MEEEGGAQIFGAVWSDMEAGCVWVSMSFLSGAAV